MKRLLEAMIVKHIIFIIRVGYYKIIAYSDSLNLISIKTFVQQKISWTDKIVVIIVIRWKTFQQSRRRWVVRRFRERR